MRVLIWARVATALVVLAGAVALAGGPAARPAWAHSRLLRTDPAGATTVTRPVTQVTLTFNEAVQGDFTTVVVDGPGDTGYGDGHVRVVDHDVSQATYPLPSGDYRVAWRAVSADGHPVQGEFRFTVALPAGQEPTARPARVAATGAQVTAGAAAGGSGGGWLWGGGAAVALGLGAAALTLARRRRGAGAR